MDLFTVVKGSLKSTDSDTTSPGHPLFSARSSNTDGTPSRVLRKLISLSSKDSSNDEPDTPQSGPGDELRRLGSSLVPPNYKYAFQRRLFNIHTPARGDWAGEIVALADNAVRQELNDMYAIFEEMEKRPLMLDATDIEMFCDWFSTFFQVLCELFELEEDCLYAWVEGVDMLSAQQRRWETSQGRVPRELSEVRRGKIKAEIKLLGGKIAGCHEIFENRPVAQALPEFAPVVEDFVDKLVAYMELKKAILPSCIAEHLRQRDCSRFHKSYWEVAARLPNAMHTVTVATRWMTRKQRQRWKRKCLPYRLRSAFAQWQRPAYDEHFAIVSAFKDRVKESELERIQQVEESGMARARAQESPPPCVREYADSEAASGSCASFHRSSTSFHQDSIPVFA